MPTYTKSSPRATVPLLYIGETTMTASQSDDVVTNNQIPTQNSTAAYNWTLVETDKDNGIVINQNRDTVDLRSGQAGILDSVITDEITEMVVTLRSDGLQEQNLAVLDPSYTSGNNMDLKNNEGIALSTKAYTFLLIGKDKDISNLTDTPDVTADPDTRIYFQMVQKEGTTANWNLEQKTLTVTFVPLAVQSSGSSNGHYGRIGTFTETA